MPASCPISTKQLNEKSIRIGAGLVLLLTVSAIVFHNIWIVIILTVDFFIRGFTRYPISPVSFLSKFIGKILLFEPNWVNAGSKVLLPKSAFFFA